MLPFPNQISCLTQEELSSNSRIVRSTEKEENDIEQLGIIGAGPGGADLLRTFLTTPNVRLIGIADPNPSSPGIVLAKQHKIFSTANFQDLLNKPGKKILFDATGIPAVTDKLLEAADDTTIVVRPEVAKLIWEMVDAREEVNTTLAHESDTLLSFIEKGLEHLEILNNEHGKTLQTAVDEIKDLSKLTEESQTLIQETTNIMNLIKNVANQTRILGINASIESARAGEHGRGFSVVADSIHQLSATSLKSVQSVSETMESIREVLQGISNSVEKIVADIQDIEVNQETLTQELHISLEEMVKSAEKLSTIAGKK